MKITKNFALEEFHCHDGTPYPAEWETDRLIPLCEQLELIRKHFNAAVTVLSGYRTEEYNRKIGGAKASQHVQGRAADITIQGYSAARVHLGILDMCDRKEIELGGIGGYPGFTHVDVRPGTRLVQWYGSRVMT